MMKKTKTTPPAAKNTLAFYKEFKPRTKNQANVLRTMVENDITIVHGVAGSGKSLLAIGLALEHLRDGKIKKIIIVRPTIESSPRGLGFLKGTLDEKLEPYLVSTFEEIKEFIGKDKLDLFIKNGTIEIASLEYMRGRNFKNCYVIADECQNATLEQLKMLMTRLCDNAKIFILGDTEQTDLGYTKFSSGLQTCINKLENNVDGLGVCQLDITDIQRNKIIGQILNYLK